MSPQFVDFNADGHLDILTATFDGSPHIAFGSAAGYAEPEILRDAKGERILIRSFWNYESGGHDMTARSMPDGEQKLERCISTLAHDWDNDGDFDLLLGSYEEGRLYRQMNEGTNAKPAFSGQNIAIEVGGEALNLPGKMTAPRLVDWDADGDLDLLVGSCKTPAADMGGAIYLALNEGKEAAPVFASLEEVIPPQTKNVEKATHPHEHLYFDVFDVDGDADLDLVVGAYSSWKTNARELNEAEKDRVADLNEQREETQALMQEIHERIRETVAKEAGDMDTGSNEYSELYRDVAKRFLDEQLGAHARYEELNEELATLVAVEQRKAFVWYYERISESPKPDRPTGR